MEITKEQVLSFLSENKEVINEVLTATHVENYLSNQEGQKLIQPKLDKTNGNGIGLANLSERYRLKWNTDITISDDGDDFAVIIKLKSK